VTTVVYRDGVLAADRRYTEKDFICPELGTKVWKNKHGWAFAGAGQTADLFRAAEWAHSELGSTKQRKTNPPSGDMAMIIVSPKRELFCLERGQMYPLAPNTPFLVAGTGAQAALGALYHGATAIEAVEIAMKIDFNSGGGVDHVTIGE
jgi:hypothetical protein